MRISSIDSLKVRTALKVGDDSFSYFNLPKAAEKLGIELSKLPFSLRILLENLIRNENNRSVKLGDIEAMAKWLEERKSSHEIAFFPARVFMQDFTGGPAVVDLAAMRDAMKKIGSDPNKINPLTPVDLVIDHSVQVDHYGQSDALAKNVALEMQRNNERYEFLRWGQEAFNNFRVVPPGIGICHQVNLEYLAKVVWSNAENGEKIAYPDSVVGTDSHTTMINGLSVLGWGVGGIEAEAAMLGQPISMLIPEVVGFKLTGQLKEGVTATDLVLTVTEMLRKKGVVNKFVEFFGNGLDHLALADRATIANMAPEYGATCGFFPIDVETIKYLKLSGRDEQTISLVEAYAKAQCLWRDKTTLEPLYTDVLQLDLSTVEASLAGPKRPQDRVPLPNVNHSFSSVLPTLAKKDPNPNTQYKVEGADFTLQHGHVVIAAITSCTNTSNPSVMVAAGLLARNAMRKGLSSKPWVKASLAPGSKVVSEYLKVGGLQESLDALGFNLVGYGCTTCIGNSGPLKKQIEDTISINDVVVASVLSGNRNFEGRVHPLVKANYLASPPLVVAYAIVGTTNIDLTKEPIGMDKDGNHIYLRDIWPSSAEINDYINKIINAQLFKSKYQDVFAGNKEWQDIKTVKSMNYSWTDSSYINNPPYFEHINQPVNSKLSNIQGAHVLAIFGDSITTDHISPAGNIAKSSPAASYLRSKGVQDADFNSYGARRGNHEVMMRGTFANIRIKNEMLDGIEGGMTKHIPTGEVMSIYDAAMNYKGAGKNLIVIAGKEYGTGSSRDWAAKGTMLLGVKAVVAESFERIHRSNLVGMGVLPLLFTNGMTRHDLKLVGDETFDILGLDNELKPRMMLELAIHRASGDINKIPVLCRIDTEDEVAYILNGGILQYVVRNLK
jgi:aconitate hydratase